MKKITTILVIALLIVALFTMVACDTTQESNNNIDLDQTMSESIEQADIAEKKGVVSNSNSADVTESTSVRTDGKFVFVLNRRLPEKAMAPHSSALAWRIPWTEEPGGRQSMGSLRVGHD